MERIELNGVWYIREKKSIKIDYSITNLDVITYRNGDSIPEVKDPKEWSELTTGAYCYYDNDSSKGILYNWYAVNDLRGLAPLGWKIPDNKEIDLLDLKTNSQFSGYRNNDGNYYYIGANGYWWSSSETSTNLAWYRFLFGNFGNVYRHYDNKLNGFSVRCLRDNVKTIKEDDLKDWDVTLNDGLENEPYVSDDFQIGPDGAYEHTEDWPEDTTPREKAKSELINLLLYQIMDLTTMSKIELGDDVITEIRRLKDVIKIGEQEIEKNKTMTPREKASELIVDYQMVVTSLDYNEAKQCALVMVDEIKRILYDQDSMIRYDYWFEVKQEIEKL